MAVAVVAHIVVWLSLESFVVGKKTVDEIFMRLASNESVKKMYNLWCEMEQQKHDVYSSAKVQFPKLVDNKEFRSVKNMIVQTVMQMNFSVSEIDIKKSELSAKIDDTKADSDVKNSLQNENTEIEIQPLDLLRNQDTENVHMNSEPIKKIENEMDYPGQIKVNIIRETRVVDYAK